MVKEKWKRFVSFVSSYTSTKIYYKLKRFLSSWNALIFEIVFFKLKNLFFQFDFLISAFWNIQEMRNIVWFQRAMIITLVSLNVLFYSYKTDQPLETIVGLTTASICITGCLILIYANLKKRRQAKFSVVKKSKNWFILNSLCNFKPQNLKACYALNLFSPFCCSTCWLQTLGSANLL